MTKMKAQCRKAHAIKATPGGLEKWLGLIVKKGFAQTADPQVDREWMWVKITAVEGTHLIGTLLNDPCFATYLQEGDRVTLTEDEIYAVAE